MRPNVRKASIGVCTRSALLISVGTFTAFASGYSEATAQEAYTVVADLAIAVMESPGRGDAIIAGYSASYDSKFYAAIDDRIAFFGAHAASHYAYCNQYRTDPQANRQCYQENEPAKAMHLLETLRDATRDNPRWSRSALGEVSIHFEGTLGEDYWSSLQRAYFEQVRHLFIVMFP